MTYGTQPTGFVRKPLSVILAELEAAMVTEFGPGIIQTPQSPMGTINGLVADAVAEVWELGEDIYQSFDVDQAEGTRLDVLGRYRLVVRQGLADEVFRRIVTNVGQARVDIQDIEAAVSSIDGVTFVAVWINGTDLTDANGLPPGAISVVVEGGVDQDVADAIRSHVVPGVITYGNTSIESMIDGYCRTLYIVRPVKVPVTLSIQLRLTNDKYGCPPPSPTAIINGLVADWYATRNNGKDVNYYTVRQLIESRHDGVEVVSLIATRGDLAPAGDDNIGFTEIGELSADSIYLEIV